MDCENMIERKTREEIKKLQIDNNKAMGNLIDKRVVKAAIEDMARVVKGSFVDMPKIHAPKIAKILDAPERESEIKKVLTDMIQDTLIKVVEVMKPDTSGIKPTETPGRKPTNNPRNPPLSGSARLSLGMYQTPEQYEEYRKTVLETGLP